MELALQRSAARVAEAASQLRAEAGPVLVAIDGPGGAGKSTLAAAAAARLGATVVPVDDFYRPMPAEQRAGLDPQTGFELYFDWPRLVGQVLDPLVVGEGAAYQRYDWEVDALSDDVVVVPSAGLVIVEGVYTLRPQLRGYWDLAVWVDTPRDVRLARCLARAGHDGSWVERWAAAEDWYVAHHDPAAAAHLVVPGA